MKNNNLIRFVQSLVLLPVMSVGVHQTVLVPKLNIDSQGILAFNQAAPEVDPRTKILEAHADAIDSYFSARSMPLFGTGMKMVIEADKNDIDWRLLPAIAVRESTGGKNDCKKVANNPFGWGSCKIGFKTLDAAIETVARNIGGNNPNTDQHYAGKTTKQILQKYNPPSVVPNYANQVMSIMDAIGKIDAEVTSPATT